MIDTDKYEGHTEGPWWIEEVLDNGQKSTWLMGNFPQDNMLFYIEPTECNDTDAQLIADAPLLLAEVKRLRGLLDTIVDITLKELKIFDDNCPMIKIRDLAYKGILWRNKE